jgi:hypothetical protein
MWEAAPGDHRHHDLSPTLERVDAELLTLKVPSATPHTLAGWPD